MDDILKVPNMDKYLKVFYSEYLLDLYPKELSALPLARQEQVGKTPWNEPFSVAVDQLMDAVNLVMDLTVNHTRRAISLWNPKEDWTIEKEEKNGMGGKDSVFLIAPSISEIKKDKEKKPAVIICPGGGYEAVCFSGEGTPIMHYMEAQGYRAFILKYRVAPAMYPAPHEDLALAIQYVRANAEEYGIDENDIMILGASAGGHLCSSFGALYEEAAQSAYKQLKETDAQIAERLEAVSARPDKVCLCYPVISLVQEAHEGSAIALTGKRENLKKYLSVENLVDTSYPPTFVWTCADDDCVLPSNAKRMGDALKKAGVPYELHIYPSGGHGCALAFSKEAYDWSRAMIEFFRGFEFTPHWSHSLTEPEQRDH